MFCIPVLESEDLFEFNLDRTKLPVVFTLRENPKEIPRFAKLQPEYFDVGSDLSPPQMQKLRKEYPNIKWIVSHHDYEKTPCDLDALLADLKKLPADLYKIACTAQSTNDSLRMLDLVQRNRPLLGMCMGELGVITRILGPKMGAPWAFAALSPDQKSADGQLTIDEHRSLYSYGSKFYGLIGDPITTSIGDIVHNRVMQEMELDALYVKMRVRPDELEEFFPLATKIGIQGLSVTMPLKEHVIPFLDQIDPEIGAVNTIRFHNGKLLGTNTDCTGALDALEKRGPVCGKKIVILGAGGAAKAIIYEALNRGAKVHVLNRTKQRALDLAKTLPIHVLDQMPDTYDILINATPHPHKTTTTMDINIKTTFGKEMFIEQAIAQYDFWFDQAFDRTRMKKIMEEVVARVLI